MTNSTTAFAGKTLMITGGTGSFGSTVLKHFMNTDVGEIRIFSRDEKKQDDMRHRLQERSPELASKVRFFIGDVRDAQSVRDAMHGVDYIFHAAALKQVPSCEFFPMEAVRTNVIGTDNVLHAAIAEGVDRVVSLSTDKAAYCLRARKPRRSVHSEGTRVDHRRPRRGGSGSFRPRGHAGDRHPPWREALRDAHDPRGALARRGHGRLLSRCVRFPRPQLR